MTEKSLFTMRIVHYWGLTVISLREARSSRPVQDAGSINEVVAYRGDITRPVSG